MKHIMKFINHLFAFFALSFALISCSGSMRRVYYREIAMHENYDNLYSETKRNLIVSAMRKAGGN